MNSCNRICIALCVAALLGMSLLSASPARSAGPNKLSFDEIAKLVAAEGAADDQFGSGVALSGDTLVVGAPNADGHGAAYVFVKPAGGWNSNLHYAAKLAPSDGASADAFGAFVAIEGDIVLVGSYLHDVDGAADRGQAYVFVKPPSGWQGTLNENARLRAQNGAATDYFGVAVAISEAQDVLVVGAHHADDSRGAGYVFVKPAGGWNGILYQDAKLTHVGAMPGEFLGRDVDISGDTIVVGGYGVDWWSGRSYVYLKPVGGWYGERTEDAVLGASNGGAEFGSQVAISGDTIVVGAYPYDTAYVFAQPAGGWHGAFSEDAQLVRAKRRWGGFFAYTLEMDGDTIVVGAFQEYRQGQPNRGAAYVFTKPAGGWQGVLTQNARLTASDGAAWDEFGLHLGISGDTIAVGARLADIGAQADRGAVYVFTPGTVTPSADLSLKKTLVTATRRNDTDKFELTVRNAGTARAKKVVLVDTVPSGLRVLAVTSSEAQCSTQGQTVRCTKNRLGVNQTFSVFIAVTVREQDTANVNCAEVTAKTTDPHPDNNRACVERNARR
jgi:uncharacterized repeat protein (TIGR01451 family)